MRFTDDSDEESYCEQELPIGASVVEFDAPPDAEIHVRTSGAFAYDPCHFTTRAGSTTTQVDIMLKSMAVR